MKRRADHLPVGTALAGLGVQVCGIAWAIILFNATHKGGFSFLNNFVSELGAPRHSLMAHVFNWTLIVSSFMIFPILISLGTHIRTRLAYAASALGGGAMAGAVGAGFAPMDVLAPHIITSMIFFWGWIFTVLLFTVAFCRRFSFRESPALVLAGIATIITCSAFLAVVFNAFHLAASTPFQIKNPQAFQRPAIWDIAILEWCVLVSVFAWNLVTCCYLLRARSKAARGSSVG